LLVLIGGGIFTVSSCHRHRIFDSCPTRLCELGAALDSHPVQRLIRIVDHDGHARVAMKVREQRRSPRPLTIRASRSSEIMDDRGVRRTVRLDGLQDRTSWLSQILTHGIEKLTRLRHQVSLGGEAFASQYLELVLTCLRTQSS
jgi:hypothetical protein